MKDRVVQYPNRYKLTQVSGDIYNLTPEPGIVTESGTPINKETLLSDSTATWFGLNTETATVDQVLEKLPRVEDTLKTEILTVTGTFTFPETLAGDTAFVRLLGGGGGGASGYGGGGGGGHMASGNVSVSAGDSVTVTIGQGGAGGRYKR